MDEIKAIYEELFQIRFNYYKPDTIIRVTEIAIEGSIVEFPSEQDEDRREILIHPYDWKELLKDPRIREVSGDVDPKVTAIFGIKVVFDPGL